MKNIKLRLGSLVVGVMVISAISIARADEVANRIDLQLARVSHDVTEGTLTGTQAVQLDAALNKIDSEMNADMSANGGKLTAAEFVQLNHQENKASLAIYAESHNDSLSGEVAGRLNLEEARITQGVNSGKLTATQVGQLETALAYINKERQTYLKQDNGKLTPAQMVKLNHQENRLSRRIYRAKHI